MERNHKNNITQVSFSISNRANKTYIVFARSTGNLKPGEMCLGGYFKFWSSMAFLLMARSKVLGVPGSGCTTFLKTIANQRGEYATVDGEVLYEGITAQEMAKLYRGEVVFNHEGRRNFD